MVASVPTDYKGSRLGLELELNYCNSFTTWEHRTVALRPGSTSNPGLCKPRFFAPIKYLSSDHIMTGWICRLYTSSSSFTSCFQKCDVTNIHLITIQNLRILLEISPHFTATQRISVRSQIWKRDVQERLILHNLLIYHVPIRLQLKYLFRAEAVGVRTLELSSGSNPAKNPQLYFWSR